MSPMTMPLVSTLAPRGRKPEDPQVPEPGLPPKTVVDGSGGTAGGLTDAQVQELDRRLGAAGPRRLSGRDRKTGAVYTGGEFRGQTRDQATASIMQGFQQPAGGSLAAAKGMRSLPASWDEVTAERRQAVGDFKQQAEGMRQLAVPPPGTLPARSVAQRPADTFTAGPQAGGRATAAAGRPGGMTGPPRAMGPAVTAPAPTAGTPAPARPPSAPGTHSRAMGAKKPAKPAAAPTPGVGPAATPPRRPMPKAGPPNPLTQLRRNVQGALATVPAVAGIAAKGAAKAAGRAVLDKARTTVPYGENAVSAGQTIRRGAQKVGQAVTQGLSWWAQDAKEREMGR